MCQLARILAQRARVLCVLSYTHLVEDAVRLMTEHGVGAVLVVDVHDKLTGVFTEHDLLRRVIYPGRDPRTTALAEVMTTEVVTAVAEDSVDRAIQKMRDIGCRHLPIVHDGAVVALLSMGDLLDVELEERRTEVSEMRSYISGAY